jgi:valyl-tRNA synthetase
MWEKLDEFLRDERLNRSEFFEEHVRQTLEAKGKESTEESGLRISVSTILRSIHRLKDFIVTNSREHTIGNLETVRGDLVEAAAFLDQEINRSRTPTKRERKELALKQAIEAHRARIDNNGIVMNAPPSMILWALKKKRKRKRKRKTQSRRSFWKSKNQI